MKNPQRGSSSHVKLPQNLRPLFWDHDFARLCWTADRDLIIGRVLAVGNWESLRWLRRRVPKPVLGEWIMLRQGAGLSARQLRFWELILKLPHAVVNSWLADPARRIWEAR